MKLTGRQLFETALDTFGGMVNESWENQPASFRARYELWAEKLNGMMVGAPVASASAESGLTMFDHWMGDKRRKQSAINLEQLDRARHSAICPYRYGKGKCTC